MMDRKENEKKGAGWAGKRGLHASTACEQVSWAAPAALDRYERALRREGRAPSYLVDNSFIEN